MLKRLFILSLFFTAYSTSAAAGEYLFCLMFNRVASAGKLTSYSDKQIKNSLCMTTKEMLSGIVTDDTYKQAICGQAGKYAMVEFIKRFPNLSPRTVAGKC